MTTLKNNKKPLSLSIAIALAGLVGCGPAVYELEPEELEARLTDALVEAQGEVESEREEGHDENWPDAEATVEDQEINEDEVDEDEEREIEPCEVEIVDGLVAAPGETLEIQWDAHRVMSSQVYVSAHSGWGEVYYLSTIAPNNGSFLWELPFDLDPAVDDYTVYVESADDDERTMECWDYADLFVVPADVPEDDPISIEPNPSPAPADLVGAVLEMAAHEACTVKGVLMGHFTDGQGMANSTFHGKGLNEEGLRGVLRGQCSDALAGEGHCKGMYKGTEGETGHLRTRFATLGRNDVGAVGTFRGGWKGNQDDATDQVAPKHGHMAGVWQESAEHQKGMFLGFWSACSE